MTITVDSLMNDLAAAVRIGADGTAKSLDAADLAVERVAAKIKVWGPSHQRAAMLMHVEDAQEALDEMWLFV